MGIRMALTKQSPIGEQFVVDVGSWNPVTGEQDYATIDDMLQAAQSMLKLADLRTEEMHLRMLEGYGVEQYVTPEQWTKILDVLEIVCGRQNLDTVVRRWQSAQEETAMLEKTRAEYAASFNLPTEPFAEPDMTMEEYKEHLSAKVNDTTYHNCADGEK